MKKMAWLMAIALALALAFAACDNGTTGGGDTGNSNSVTYTSYDSKGNQYKLVITKGTDSPGTDPGVIVGPGPGGYRDSQLVNGANDVWADSFPAGQRDGFIFKADGTVHLIDDYTNTTPGVWKIFGTGTWYNTVTTGNSNRLTFTGNGSSMTYQYTVTSTTLTLTDSDGDSQTFTKTTATVSGRSAVTPVPAEKTGTKAITGAIKRAVSADLGSPAGRAAAGRAAYKPKSGDEFTLTIKDMLTGDTEGTSTGTVSDISSDGDSDTLTLDNDEKEFTVKVKDLFIEEITGTIPLDNGSEWEEPDTLYPNDPNNPSNGPKKWTAVANTTFGTYSIKDIAYGNNRWVAVGNMGKMAYSANNGVTWTAVADTTFDPSQISGPPQITAIAYGGGKFVAGNSSGKMAYSSDGASWTAVTDSTFGSGYYINAIAYGGGKFVAVGDSGKIAYSTDGISWTAVADSKFGSSFNTINAIAYGGNRFVAGGVNGKMAYSTDGISWTAVADSAVWQYGSGTARAGILSIAYGNGTWVAGGNQENIAYSKDNGVTWTAVPNPNELNYPSWAIAYGNGRFVAGGSVSAAFSADGASWTGTSPAIYPINAIAYGNGRFVAVGNGKIAYADWGE